MNSKRASDRVAGDHDDNLSNKRSNFSDEATVSGEKAVAEHEEGEEIAAGAESTGLRILSALSDRLYDVYHATKSAKELWNLLQGEYGIDDAGIERFNASTFNKFVMVEGKAISDQIHEFQDHLRAVEENGSKFSEDYKVSCLIDKLPPSWSDFAKGLRHKQGTLTLTQAFNSLRIEEKHRESIKQKGVTSNQANLVENNITPNTPHHLRPRWNNFRNNNRRNTQGNNNFHRRNSRHNNFLANRFPQNNNNQLANLPNHKNAKDAKGKGKKRPCYVCGRTNHIARDCFYKRVEEYKPNGERLLLIPMVIVLLCVMLRKGFTLNEPEADIFARYSHTYPWRTHLNESGREAATVGTGLIPKDSRENQD
ncbi:hypothetical protein RJ640_010889 [Escallonia rubra]|uniref:CCHC-type domain-containing protein n=1 Tax=Escallonia rubra TaxID=112253 RepID=A0AA88QRC8_9ASTE|nr:hypothetical protein RJ640_010889 [Escallonia rubra]